MPDAQLLEDLVQAVQAGARYRMIHADLVRRIGSLELAKGHSFKDAVKETRSKLHQVAGAYQETTPDYARLAKDLQAIDPAMPQLREFCLRAMNAHASTRERLPYLDEFYRPLRDRLGEINSILDLACGINPLALPWIPIKSGGEYLAYDIYADMIQFINQFFIHVGMKGKAELCDLTAAIPERPVQLALLLKTLPCLEQIDRSIGPRLLEGIQAEHVLVSFPALSLGGRGKGMAQSYTSHFEAMIAGRGWKVDRWSIRTEICFLLSK